MSVHPVKNTSHDAAQSDRKSKQRSVTAEESAFFRSLLGGMPNAVLNNIAVASEQGASSVQMSGDLLSTLNENMLKAATTMRSPSSDTPPPAQPPATIDPQLLSLRVSTGPLAGMLLQAGWQGNKLNLQFSCPEGFDADRLRGQIEKIEAALAAGLGCDVAVQVKHGE